ncbi:MAG: UDP-N-acetylglucosamine 2-epimerase [bacterium]
MMKKICVITGTRAEYGLLRWIMQGILESEVLTLQTVVTGMHLSPEFGLTYRDIEADGFTIDHKIEMLLSSDTSVGITKSIGLATCGFADAFAQLKPDIVVILGDRYEIFAAASAALVARIPIAHLHGGEVTTGAFDDAIRHALTKLSHWHFVAAEPYRQRVIQLGENPDYVYNVGGLGVDSLHKQILLERDELQQALGFTLGRHNLLVTYHPVTLETQTAAGQMNTLLTALEAQLNVMNNLHLIFTLPNSDTDSRVLFSLIKSFVKQHPQRCKAYTSLGTQRYLSCLPFMDGVVGNSSSGLLEAPSFKIGTINIGDRQHGRLKASSVLDCFPEQDSISRAITQLFSKTFQTICQQTINPYGNGGSSERIVTILEQSNPASRLKKQFWDIPNDS